MMNLLRDLRYAARLLIKSPIFSLTAILTLALGIGANTAMFSVVDALIIRQLPVAEPSQLVLFGDGRSMGSAGGLANRPMTLFSYPMFRELQRRNSVFSEMAAMKSIMMDVHGRVQSAAELEKLHVQLVSGSYFPMLGIAPGAGRLFTDDDDKIPGGHPFAVASHAWWAKRFGEAPVSDAKTITIGTTVYTIVGVAPSTFFGTTVGDTPNLWIPLSMDPQISPGWNGLADNYFQANHLLGRMKPGVTMEKAQVEINYHYKQVLESFVGSKPSEKDLASIKAASIQLTPSASGLSELRSKFAKPLNILFGMVGLVLLIACANLANLLLARAAARSREITIRMAVGAGRARLVRQLLTESLLLAAVGGVLGAIVASFGAHMLINMVTPGTNGTPLDAGVNLRALGFTSLVCFCAAILFGLVPALRATRVQGNLNLKEGKGSSSDSGRSPFGNALLVGQVAVSLMLLAGAGLFIRTLANMSNADLGLEKNNVLIFSPDFSAANYKEDAQLDRLYDQIEAEVERIPGVKAAAFSAFTFGQGFWSTPVSTASMKDTDNIVVTHNAAGSSFFTAMGIPLLAGRTFLPTDTMASQRVAVVNELFAKTFFTNQSALGQRFYHNGSDVTNSYEIVGVVRTANHGDVKRELYAMAYYPHAQRHQYIGNFVVRYAGDEASVVSAVRKTFARLDKNIPVSDVRTLLDRIQGTMVDQKVMAEISAVFATLALFLACVGIYGVTAYRVSCQTREIGVRMALGAQRRQIFSLIIGQTLRVLAIGIVIGLPAVLGAQRLVVSQLYGVQPADLTSGAIAAALIAIAALLAGFIPAGAATRLHPNEALRSE
jgi:predicted permease